MKKIYLIIFTSLAFFSIFQTFPRQEKPIKEIFNSQSASFHLFTAENGSTGKYWPQDKTAILEEEEYIKVIAINKNKLNEKFTKKLRKNKMYLGSFIDKKTQKIYYVYGVVKNPAPIDNGPDADVLTEIAIKMDYGPGE